AIGGLRIPPEVVISILPGMGDFARFALFCGIGFAHALCTSSYALQRLAPRLGWPPHVPHTGGGALLRLRILWRPWRAAGRRCTAGMDADLRTRRTPLRAVVLAT